MNLKEESFILFDFQTSGTNADDCYIIEAGWGLYRAEDRPENTVWYNHQIKLPPGVHLPARIQHLTGLLGEAKEDSLTYAELGAALGTFLECHPTLAILIHYARFKQPFLTRLLEDHGLDTSAVSKRVICTYQLAKNLVPQLKSYSLRAVAGYANYSLGEKKRTKDHLLATAYAWRYLENSIHLAEAYELTQLPEILAEYRPAVDMGSKPNLHTEELRTKRLALPNEAGIYFFVDRSDRVLYVGKARQLKARVNSYFRGKKTKGSRLNEMLTRAVDLRVKICQTELEALLEESDAIKRHNPPYNILLTQASRGVHWLNAKIFGKDNLVWGPLSSLWTWHSLQPFLETSSIPGSRAARLERLMGKKGIADSWLDESLIHWLSKYGLAEPSLLLNFGDKAQHLFTLAPAIWKEVRAERSRSVDEKPSEWESVAEEEEFAGENEDLTAEDLHAILYKTLGHLCYQIHRGRWLLRLLEAEITWEFAADSKAKYRVSSHHGVINIREESGPIEAPPAYSTSRRERSALINLACFDRLSILYSAIKRGLQGGDRIRLCLRPGLVLDENSLRTQII